MTELDPYCANIMDQWEMFELDVRRFTNLLYIFAGAFVILGIIAGVFALLGWLPQATLSALVWVLDAGFTVIAHQMRQSSMIKMERMEKVFRRDCRDYRQRLLTSLTKPVTPTEVVKPDLSDGKIRTYLDKTEE